MAVSNRYHYEPPNAEEAELAANGHRILSELLGVGEAATLRIIVNKTDIMVPVTAIKILVEVLEQMALGNAISIAPIKREMTTQEAADLLNVSRPFLIQQILDQGKIPFHRAGNRRKVLFKDVVAYRKRIEEESDKLMMELATLSQALEIVG